MGPQQHHLTWISRRTGGSLTDTYPALGGFIQSFIQLVFLTAIHVFLYQENLMVFERYLSS